MRTKLEITFISISFLLTALLFILLGSLFVIISPADIINSLLSYEMLYALQLTVTTSLIAAHYSYDICIAHCICIEQIFLPIKNIS